MNISIAFNSNYYLPAVIMLYSLCEHNDGPIDIYIFYRDLKRQEMTGLKNLIAIWPGKQLHFIYMDELTNDHKVNRYVSIETYYRYMGIDKLPLTLDRILYLDVDILIRKSLLPLYQCDFDGKSMVGCLDDTSNPLQRLGLAHYVNAGVLLMNLENMRNSVKLRTLMNYDNPYQYELALIDQDILNIVYKDDFRYESELLWNCAPLRDGVTEEGRRIAEENTAIVHFISKYKPWRDEDVAYLKNAPKEQLLLHMFLAEYEDTAHKAIKAFEIANGE
jgi:lipopolysaccharide biosynthesis glycosyltransferase